MAVSIVSHQLPADKLGAWLAGPFRPARASAPVLEAWHADPSSQARAQLDQALSVLPGKYALVSDL